MKHKWNCCYQNSTLCASDSVLMNYQVHQTSRAYKTGSGVTTSVKVLLINNKVVCIVLANKSYNHRTDMVMQTIMYDNYVY